MSNLLLKKKHPDKGALEARRKHIFLLLIETTKLLKKCLISNVCCSGTALGLYRDGGIIFGDSDFDIAIKYTDLNKEFISWGLETKRFNRPGTKLTNDFWFAPNIDLALNKLTSGKPFNPFNLKIHLNERVERQIIFGDIFLLYDPQKDFTKHKDLFPKNCYVYPYKIPNKNIKFFAIPKPLFDNRFEINIGGDIFNLPGDPEKYLTSRYGCGWNKEIVEDTKGFKGDYTFNPFISMSEKKFNEIKVKTFLDI